MWITIIILAYVANVFLNRWLEKILFHKTWERTGKRDEAIPFLWFLSLVTTFFLMVTIIEDSKFYRWFAGKHW